MVAEGDDLSSRWTLMQDFANEVNSIGYEYRPISQNSNSFAGGALQRAGFLGPGNEFPERFDRQLAHDPASGEIRSFYVPGFEAPLTNPINTATPMPFPLDVPVAPLALSDGVAAPGRHGSLDNGSGNFGSAPASVQGAPDDKPVRYLGRRTDRLSQGSVIDPAASGATSQRPPRGPLSLNDAFLEYLKQLNANPSRESRINTGTPAAPFVPADDLNFSGGLLGRLTALIGIDPQNPDQLAPPPQDDQRAFYRDPAQQRTLQRLR
jgi:hypothetical protein